MLCIYRVGGIIFVIAAENFAWETCLLKASQTQISHESYKLVLIFSVNVRLQETDFCVDDTLKVGWCPDQEHTRKTSVCLVLVCCAWKVWPTYTGESIVYCKIYYVYNFSWTLQEYIALCWITLHKFCLEICWRGNFALCVLRGVLDVF